MLPTDEILRQPQAKRQTGDRLVVVAGQDHYLDLDADGDTTGYRQANTWIGEAPVCPSCLTDLSPRLHTDPRTLDEACECLDCGRFFDAIDPRQQQELELDARRAS